MKPLEIWQPRYSTDDCLILASKIKSDNQLYSIYFTKAQHLLGNRYVLRGVDIKKKSKIEKVGKNTMYVIPMSTLENYKEVV